MKKLLALLTVAAAFGMLASVSQANCIASGEISRISTNPGNCNFFVRTSTPGSVSFLFASVDDKVCAATVTAQASHMRVTVTGNAAACGAVSGGISAGGTVITITTAP